MMKKAMTTLIVLVSAAALGGCVIAPARGPGFCYYHPHACGR